MKIKYSHRYLIELVGGLIMIAALLVFGTKGELSFFLLFTIPIIELMIKPDERERALFQNTNKLTIIIGIIIFLALSFYSHNTTNEIVRLIWWRLAIATSIALHGGIGIYYLKYK
ncbi:MAG: hypothetical protein WCZ90_05825 [Melioribacteraceae bacterium]